ncbi:hypothetical protein Glove_109g238 [Diversispora epigaea]|uniref:Uncharacterized protein n=1 Tax=Diversispora epigaea TaxID=1348612 RepID=A0A397J8S1_9GLOM|nr:hypothetical protein Glove_109g238 [Diversispora epigaea]
MKNQGTNYIKHETSNVINVEMAELEQVKEVKRQCFLKSIFKRSNSLIEIMSARGNTALELSSTHTTRNQGTNYIKHETSNVINVEMAELEQVKEWSKSWMEFTPSHLLQASTASCIVNRRFVQNNINEMRVQQKEYLYELVLEVNLNDMRNSKISFFEDKKWTTKLKYSRKMFSDSEENPFYPILNVPTKPVKEFKKHLDIDLYALEKFHVKTFNKDDDDEISSDGKVDKFTLRKIPLLKTSPPKPVSSTPSRNISTTPRNIFLLLQHLQETFLRYNSFKKHFFASKKQEYLTFPRTPLFDDEGSNATVGDDDDDENLFNLTLDTYDEADEKINLFLKGDDSYGGSISTVTATLNHPKPQAKKNCILTANKFSM